ncbi:hypothetical protein BJ170DRAFT_600389 [Xylariales sp. AK1849]|nr:hypothetical protein BJ170DRAFT_600389 [Xylariales sp. AK1849]
MAGTIGRFQIRRIANQAEIVLLTVNAASPTSNSGSEPRGGDLGKALDPSLHRTGGRELQGSARIDCLSIPIDSYRSTLPSDSLILEGKRRGKIDTFRATIDATIDAIRAIMEPQPSIVGSMGSRTKWAKPEDWERLRNTITALWMMHSLPVVMRIMRDEHDFHATPKMFQAQLYQKWGLRKGRPEKQSSKKRRLSPEEPDSVASSSYIPATTQQGSSTVSSEGLSFTPHPANLPERTVNRSDVASHGTQVVTTPSLTIHTPSAGDQDQPSHSTQSSDALMLVPSAWNEFISKSQSPRMTVAQDHGGFGSVIVESPPDEEDSFREGPNSIVTDSTSWMSTVMTTPPSITPTPQSGGLSSGISATSRSSARTRKSEKSGRSRKSYASSSRETLLSSTSRSSALSAKPPFGLPLGSLRHLEAPDAILLPEKSMFFARHYISSTFATGLWTLSQTSDSSLLNTECIKLDRWYNDFNPGLDQLMRPNVGKAFSILQPCFAATEGIIAIQDPRVVIYICQQAIRFMFCDRIGRSLSKTLLRYTAGCCKKLFGVQHPLYILLAQLAQMDYHDFARNIGALMECYFEHLEPFLDQTSESFGFLLELRGLTISLMEATGMMGIYQAQPTLDRLIQRADSLGHSNLLLKIEIAAALQRNRFFDESKIILSELRASDASTNHPYEFVYASLILMITRQRTKDYEGAILLGYELIDYLTASANSTESAFNNELYKSQVHSSLVTFLSKTEHNLQIIGRTDEADQIHKRFEAAVNREYSVSESPTDADTAEALDLDNME